MKYYTMQYIHIHSSTTSTTLIYTLLYTTTHYYIDIHIHSSATTGATTTQPHTVLLALLLSYCPTDLYCAAHNSSCSLSTTYLASLASTRKYSATDTLTTTSLSMNQYINLMNQYALLKSISSSDAAHIIINVMQQFNDVAQSWTAEREA